MITSIIIIITIIIVVTSGISSTTRGSGQGQPWRAPRGMAEKNYV